MANVRTLKLNLLGDVSDFSKSMGKAQTETRTFSQNLTRSMKSVAKGAAIAGAAVAGMAVAFGVNAVKAYAEDEKGQRRLAIALKNTTGASKKQVAQVEKFISKTSLAKGVVDDKLRPAFQKLVSSTKDITKAQELMNLALDVSAATGKDVNVVSMALAKGYLGNNASLGRLGLGLDSATLKSKDFGLVQEKLAKITGGQASAAADTLDGKMSRVKIAMDEAKESIGGAIFTAIAPFAEKWLPKVSTGIGHFVDGLIGGNGSGGVKGAAEDSQTAIYNLGEKTRGFFKFLGDHEEMLKRIATVIGAIFIGAKASAAASAMVTAVKLLIPAFNLVTVAAGTTAAAEAAATGGASLGVAIPAIVGIATALGIGSLVAMYTWKGSGNNAGENLNTTLADIKAGRTPDFSGSIASSTQAELDALNANPLAGLSGGRTGVMVGTQHYFWDETAKKWYVDGLTGRDYSVKQLAAPARALGGSVMGGRSYLVGEHGPEMFTPMGGGNITPNGRLGGGGHTFILNGIIDAESARRAIERVLQQSSLRTGAVNIQGSLI
jgi:hypothetical protein